MEKSQEDKVHEAILKQRREAFRVSIGSVAAIWPITLPVGTFLMIALNTQWLLHDQLSLMIRLSISSLPTIIVWSFPLWGILMALVSMLNGKDLPFRNYLRRLNSYFLFLSAGYVCCLWFFIDDLSYSLRLYVPYLVSGLVLLNAWLFRLKKKAERAKEA